MTGFTGCEGGVCKWDGLTFLSSVTVPSTLVEALNDLAAKRAGEAVSATAEIVAAKMPQRTTNILISQPTRMHGSGSGGNGGGGSSSAMLVIAGGIVLAAGVYIGATMLRSGGGGGDGDSGVATQPPTKEEQERKTFTERVQRLFKRMHVQKTSGGLTQMDLQTLGYKNKDASWILNYIDTNHDGEVTLEEFTSYFLQQEGQVGKEKMVAHLAVFETEVEAHIARHRLDQNKK
jgi:hypothetical protein